MLISKLKAQKKLSLFWFINSGILALLFIVFTALGRFDDKVMEGWEWFSQNIIPTLTLMIGTFYININEHNEEKLIDIFYYKMCVGISIFYIFALYLTILISPISFRTMHVSIIDLFAKSKIYLVVIQGILTYCLGMFFVKEGTA